MTSIGTGTGSRATTSWSSSMSVRRTGPIARLFDVSFAVRRAGSSLVGSNGAEKSTVARVVSGLVAVSQGKVALCGSDVTGLPAYKIAWLVWDVVEGRGVFSSLTAAESDPSASSADLPIKTNIRRKCGEGGGGRGCAAFCPFPVR